MRRVVVFGADGWIGSELCRLIPDAEGVTHELCEATSCEQVMGMIPSGDPVHVVGAVGRNVNGLLGGYSDDDLHTMVKDNLITSLNISRAFCASKPMHGSSVILLGSCVPRLGVKGTAVYSAVKAGVLGMVRTLAHEFAPFYRINAIELGYFDGGLINTIPPDRLEPILDSIPLEMLGDSRSIAQTCEYLMDCSYATGGVIPLTGGL